MEKRDFYGAPARSIALAVLLLAEEGVSAETRPSPSAVVLHITDLAALDPGDFGRARTEAQRIFEEAGVRLVWVDITKGPAARACEGLNLFVSFLSPFLVQQRIAQGVKASVLGSASPSTGHAFVHTPQVRELAPLRRIDTGVLLGRVIAHEVGHLLLGGRDHSRSGLMTTGMETDPSGLHVFFSSKEARAVRARLESEAVGSGAKGAADCGERRIAGER